LQVLFQWKAEAPEQLGFAVAKKENMQLMSDIQRAWNEGGPKAVLVRSCKKLVRPTCSIGTLVFKQCDLREPLPERRAIHGIVLREAALSDANLFENREIFIDRMKSGNRCFMGIEEATGKLTNYRWLNTTAAHVPEIDRHLRLEPGEAYIYDLNTLPEFRRRGIDGYTRQCIYSYLRDCGFMKVVAYIHGDNYVSLRASRDFLKPMGVIRYIWPRGGKPWIFGEWAQSRLSETGLTPPVRLAPAAPSPSSPAQPSDANRSTGGSDRDPRRDAAQ
jgi:hypothetical protein